MERMYFCMMAPFVAHGTGTFASELPQKFLPAADRLCHVTNSDNFVLADLNYI